MYPIDANDFLKKFQKIRKIGEIFCLLLRLIGRKVIFALKFL